MATLKEWIEEQAEGQAIEAVVLGPLPDTPYNCPPYPVGKLLSWEEALPALSVKFDDGYGSWGCPAMFAWTKDRVISINEYDGRTSPFCLPRTPVEIKPGMPGLCQYEAILPDGTRSEWDERLRTVGANRVPKEK